MICFHSIGAKAGEEEVQEEMLVHRPGGSGNRPSCPPAEDDALVWADPENPSWIHGCEVTDDGEYLLVVTSYGTDPVNKLAYAHLPTVFAGWRGAASGGALGVQRALDAHGNVPPPASAGAYLPLAKFVDTFEAEWEYIANDGPRCGCGTLLGGLHARATPF